MPRVLSVLYGSGLCRLLYVGLAAAVLPTAPAQSQFIVRTQGEHAGLGCRLQVMLPDSALAVTALLSAASPAARAGVRSGDLVTAIDDSSTRGMSVATAAELLEGPAGTGVRLQLQRAGVESPLEVRVTRQQAVPNVLYAQRLDNGIGYVRMASFEDGAAAEVATALKRLLAAGITALALDLRGVSGGQMPEAVQTADLLLPPERLIVAVSGRARRDTVRYTSRQPSLIGAMPLAILVDGKTASAAEIVAGAVQDWDRGLVVGHPSLGKGSVQQPVDIAGIVRLKLSTATYSLPSGRSIDRRMRRDSTIVEQAIEGFKTLERRRIVHSHAGLEPDVRIEDREPTPLFKQLDGWDSRNNLFFHFTRQYRPSGGVTAAFRADAAVVADFRSFATDFGFEYISPLERRLQQLDKVAKEDEVERLKKQTRRLKEEIDELEEDHWKANAELIQWKLTYDLIEKNEGPEAALAYDITVDPVMLKARELLVDAAAYEEGLSKAEVGTPVDGADKNN